MSNNILIKMSKNLTILHFTTRSKFIHWDIFGLMSISRNEDILTFEVLHLASKVYFITNTAMLEPGSISEKKPQKNTKVANDLVYEILNKNQEKLEKL